MKEKYGVSNLMKHLLWKIAVYALSLTSIKDGKLVLVKQWLSALTYVLIYVDAKQDRS
jgi:hypothetical protein